MLLLLFSFLSVFSPAFPRCEREPGTLPHGQTHAACPTFESNVPFVLRYMIDSSINGSTWLELPQGTYARRTSQHMVTHTQVR